MNSRINLIVLDSNFILLPFQFKIDYFDEIRTNIEGKLRFIIFQQILDELESKRKKEPETSNFTRFFESGLLYLEKNKEKGPRPSRKGSDFLRSKTNGLEPGKGRQDSKN